MLKRNFNETWEAFKSRFYQEIKVIKSMMTINEGSLQSKKLNTSNSQVGEQTIKQVYDTFAKFLVDYMIAPTGDAKKPGGIEETSIGKLTLKITAMDNFLNLHANSEQTLSVIMFIKELQAVLQTPAEKLNFKKVESARGRLMQALVNQTIYKILVAIKQINNFDVKTKTWITAEDKQYGIWISTPLKVYTFFNYFVFEVSTLVEILEPLQVEVFAACCFSVVQQLILHLKTKADKAVEQKKVSSQL